MDERLERGLNRTVHEALLNIKEAAGQETPHAMDSTFNLRKRG